jgi:hypothetical protein
MKNIKPRELSRTERAVYDLIRTRALPDVAATALYRREVSHLAAAGLIERLPDGSLSVVGATPAPAASPVVAPVAREILENLNVRVPHAVHEALERVAGGIGRKSDVVRAILAFALPALVDAHARGGVGPDNVLDVLRTTFKANGSGTHRATGT